MRIRTASIATLGCKLNQSESDRMARQLAEVGVRLVTFGEPADLYVVNSCTVTHVGDRKSRHLIRQAARANPAAFIVVAGCYADSDPEAVRSIEGVGALLGNRGKDRLLEELRRHGFDLGSGDGEKAQGTRHKAQGDGETGGQGDGETGGTRGDSGGLREPQGDLSDSVLSPQSSVLGTQDPGPRTQDSGLRTQHSALGTPHSARTRALVKIQEGCDNHCSYCIVPAVRGHQRSRPADDVVEEIRMLWRQGYQEVVLTGVNVTAYGRDHGSPTAGECRGGMGLLRLLERIVAETDLPRLRLTSLQPEDWNERFYELWGSGRLCRHLHFSLQSGSDAVLARMRRRYNVDQYARIVARSRAALPGVAITTDVIVGFPGETEAEHLETERFLRSIGFAGLHVFKYSPRSGTAAAAMPGQVDARAKQERSERLIALAREMGGEFRSRFAGAVLPVLWEEMLPAAEVRRLGIGRGEASTVWTGLSDNYIRVYAPSETALGGTVSGALVGEPTGEGVIGKPTRAEW